MTDAEEFLRKLPKAVDGKWPFIPTIEDVRELQRHLGRVDVHIVWFGPSSFVMAHTDEEREKLGSLEECALHQWASKQPSKPVVKAGYYLATPVQHDPTSQSFRSDASPYSFTPVELP